MMREASDIKRLVMEAASVKLQQILLRAEGLGVRASVPELSAAKTLLQAARRPGTPVRMPMKMPFKMPNASRRLLLGVALSACISTWLWWWPQQRSQECLVGVPDSLALLARPPVDCSMCRGVSAVDRVQAITPEEFERKYAYSGRPVVVQDAMVNWTAPSLFSFDFLRDLYEDSLSQVDSPQDRCQFFPYDTDFAGLSEVFDMDPDRASMKPGSTPWYVGWSNCDEKVARELRTHYGRPYFLPNLSENKNIDWIFMGSPGYGAQMHVDNVRYPSWQAQLRGSKLWSLQPPPECLYECESFTVTVDPGEIIVLDTNRWYHSTKIVSEDISITIGAEYD